ncbi:hypothetical protein K470DRAFT_254563 [Piedraia hortae CBS 480.64]|uniref:C3H1-type domain-containing protein n=1 Tax=Piedraia hortae CBS 480.64 TaxID=1314780 RepID=A0A6A7C9X6_9PEZI|nr:hypothetical protein K470DRAFT_254563 [Piedraia hortae CBS 480.64]
MAGGSGRVCEYFLQGKCKFGGNCKNEHPRNNTRTFGGGGSGSGGRVRKLSPIGLPYYLNEDVIRSDLTVDRPEWKLSAYGPGRDAPRQLIGGAVEISPEEMRAQERLANSYGRSDEYKQMERNAFDQADREVRGVLNKIPEAIDYVIAGANNHPNRLDGVLKNSKTFAQHGASGMPQNLPPAQSSAFGRTNNSFGKPSPLGNQPAFGIPSPAAASSPSQNPFTAQLQAQRANSPQAPAANQSPNHNPFGAGAQVGTRTGPNPFAVNTVAASLFTQPKPQLAVATAQARNIPMAQPSPMNLTTPSPSTAVFPNKPSFNKPAFLSPAGGINLSAPATPTLSGAPAAPGRLTPALAPNLAATASYTTRDANGKLLTWKGHRVEWESDSVPGAIIVPRIEKAYIQNPQTGKQERIWHPNGPPTTGHKYAEAAPETYDGPIGSLLKSAYEYARETGWFKDGVMPEIPPKREWVAWDL